MKVTIVGAGCVGLSLATLLAEHHEVILLDIDSQRIEAIRAGRSLIAERNLSHFSTKINHQLQATVLKNEAYPLADIIIIATPTNYDEQTNCFNTDSVESVLHDIKHMASPNAITVIKSTVPVGFTEKMHHNLGLKHLLFSPEFLREGHALHDNIYPSRIVVGGPVDDAQVVARLLLDVSHNQDVQILMTGSQEAEAIKLFANSYLAMRVAFFNELDSYAATHDLDSRSIIEGVCLDPRIGMYYNNPSLGYGGYCLPKDSKQLLANYELVPQNLIGAIVQSNVTRQQFVAQEVLKLKPKTVGIYRLSMKVGSQQFEHSSILEVMKHLINEGIDLIIFEPHCEDASYQGVPLVKEFDSFTQQADVILTNRWDACLDEVKHKVYSRDVFGKD